jgi:putative membrane protein
VTITLLGFGSQVVAFTTNAPCNSDDLDPAIIDGALSAARGLGIDLMLVDSHNSIGGEDAERLKIGKDDWTRALSHAQSSPEGRFEIGMAHSSELQFDHGSDISDGGIAVLVFKKAGETSALVTADSNNAIVPLRQMIIDELRKTGTDLIDLCTSDTHKSAARYMTDRGYHALGEDSSLGSLITIIKKLEKLAEERLSPGAVTAIDSRLTLPLIGEKSLNDFAALTKEALQFTKAYARAALASALIICSVTLFF